MDNAISSVTNMPTVGAGVGAIRENVLALMASGHIWSSGCQAIGETLAASAQARLERNLSAWKAMAGVKSVKEAMDLHAQLTRVSYETMVSEARNLTDASMKLAGDSMAPIAERMALSAERVG